MRVLENNPIADLVELKISVEPNALESTQTDVRAELRIKPDDLEGEDVRCVVKLMKVSVSFRLDGMSIVPSTRYSEPIRESDVLEKVTNSKEIEYISEKEASLGIKVGGAVGGSVGAQGSGSVDLAASGKISEKHKDLKKIESMEEKTNRNVKARGNNTWEAAEADGSVLDGTYLQHEKILFSLKNVAGSNRRFVEATVHVKSRDIGFDFNQAGGFRKFTLTDKKVLAIFITKCIAGPQYSGKIVLSTVEVELE